MTVCVIEQALEDQALRLDIGGQIHTRRVALNLTSEQFSNMICCSVSSLSRLEAGLLFLGMPRLRIEALILLERLENRREGLRNGDKKVKMLSLVR